MKKTLLFEITILLIILMSCTFEPTESIGESPEMSGLQTIETQIGMTVDLLEGVTANDPEDGDLTSSIVIKNLDALPVHNQTLMFTGTYTINYEVTDSDGNTVTYTRQLIVLEQNTVCNDPLDGYTMTFCDDFLEAEIPNEYGVDTSKWKFQIGDGTRYGIPGWGNNELQYYQEQNAFVSNGLLNIEAKAEAVGGRFYTSARLWTNGSFSQRYGRFEARIKLPLGDGLWPAFWLLPQDEVYGGWAASGEIDVMEARGRIPNEASGAIHFGGSWPDNTFVYKTHTFDQNESIDQFHIYAIEWDETSIKWFFNDINYYTVTDWFSEGNPFPAPFDQRFYMLLNLAIGGVYDNNTVPPSTLFDEQVLMQIDYVRVFSKN